MAPTLRGRRGRPWRIAGLGGIATALVAGTFALAIPAAQAATLFSADFESASTSGWSKSGGTWSVVTDGTQVFQQSDATSERAREFAGSTSWTNYSVQARVKAVSFAGSTSVVALVSRSTNSTKMYRLALTGANQIQLQSMNGSAISVIATSTQTAPPTTPGTTPASPTQSPTVTPTTSAPPVNTTGLVGWATQGGGTTGGAGGPTVTVTSLSTLTTEAASSTAETSGSAATSAARQMCGWPRTRRSWASAPPRASPVAA